jgi:hypothetical protein
VRDILAGSPTDRAWARVVASELGPLTDGNPLPEIPVERSAPRGADASGGPTPSEPAPAAAPTASEPPAGEPTASGLGPAQAEAEPTRRRRWPRKRADGGAAVTDGPRSSRLGGAIILLLGVVVVAAVLFFVLRGSHSKDHTASTPSTTSAPAASASTPTSSTPTTSTSGTSASVVAQINLSPPASDKNSKAAGIAEVLNEGSVDGVAIVAQNVPANKTGRHPNAYAVWLYNSVKDASLLGFVNPAVGKAGRLSTAGRLPPNASHYKQLIVTVETNPKAKRPGSVILQGALTGL